MFLVSSCSCLCPIQWIQVSSGEWRCSWSSADRRCSSYIWVIDNFIAYWSASYVRDLTVAAEKGNKSLSEPMVASCTFAPLGLVSWLFLFMLIISSLPNVQYDDQVSIHNKQWKWISSVIYFRQNGHGLHQLLILNQTIQNKPTVAHFPVIYILNSPTSDQFSEIWPVLGHCWCMRRVIDWTCS